MATIKKAQNGAKRKTKKPEEKNIFGGSYVPPYSAKRTAKNIATKIGKGIQAIGDPVVSAGHRLGNNLEGAVDVLTGQYWDKRKKKNGGAVKKAQNGITKYSDPKPLFDKIEKTKDSISTARKKLDATKAIKDKALDKALKSNMNKIKMMKMKNGGSVKNLSAGPSKKTKIAPKVDPKGAYTKVQERTIGNMKMGGSLKKPSDDQKGLKALPTPVRNKMGYQKTGGATKMAKRGMSIKKK